MEDCKVLAEYLGYKFGYYKTYVDRSSGDDLNYSYEEINVPIIYKDENEFTNSSSNSIHSRSMQKTYVFKELPLEDYENLLEYKYDYNKLFQVIEKLEKEELEDYMYKWEDQRGMNYNFNGISVDRMRGGWDVTLHLELDPPVIIGEAWAITDDKEQLFSVLVAAVKKVNEIKAV